MAYCKKCGKELVANAKFCISCGAPVDSGTAKDEAKERTQVFVGAVRKCPNCGEPIGTNTTKCPVCGFIIEKRNISAFLDAFVKKITSFTDDRAKRDYIENYPVPNNKEDIRDLLTYAASQRDKDYDDNAAKVYWLLAWNNKCRQIVNQAFDTFGMDEDFASWLRTYKAGVEQSSNEIEKLKKKLRSIEMGKKRAAGAKKFFKGFGIVVAILAVLVGAGFGIRSCSEKQREFQKRIFEGYAIPKENVSLGGILGTYCEVIDDAKIAFTGFYEDEHYVESIFESLFGKEKYIPYWQVLRTVSVQVRFKEDLAKSYNEQCKELFNGKDKDVYNIMLHNEDLKSSLGDPVYFLDSSTTAETLLSAKKGTIMALAGTYKDVEEHKSKRGAEKRRTEMAKSSLNFVTLTMSPTIELFERKTYKSISVVPMQ
ncbi:MAG: zinc ribbon domain-containing protein [Treponema sp.]|nr:zinc ribbon domain-containing protein [Treponema sp.]MEE3434527.1 zinc ribbon domain-containing protein [Treponema sp.]